GAFSFDIAVNSDDANESPYDISVSGTTVSSGGGGGGGDKDSGCTTGNGNHLWLVLLGLLGLVAISRRRSLADNA
ncbi:MAG: MYXO-CTERM sorting domain-containing protein, partial [Planctomycetota bacterium]